MAAQTSERPLKPTWRRFCFKKAAGIPAPTPMGCGAGPFPGAVLAFLQETQTELWEQMRVLHGNGLEGLLLDTLTKELNTKACSMCCATDSSFTARFSEWPISNGPCSMKRCWPLCQK